MEDMSEGGCESRRLLERVVRQGQVYWRGDWEVSAASARSARGDGHRVYNSLPGRSATNLLDSG
jgi:hypothetical protein